MFHSASVRLCVKPSRCDVCNGSRFDPNSSPEFEPLPCGQCDGQGYLVYAESPTDARPGSPLKVRVLAERRRLGLPLFHPGDRLWPHAEADGHKGAGTGTRKPGKVRANGKRRKAS
jgi:hypothetical protein